jgi:nucleolin
MSQKLFVRNLSWAVTENELYDLFGQVGSVVSVKIPTRREDGKPRGFAFVEMASDDEAQQVIRKFNGTYLHDRDLVVGFQDDDNRGRDSYQGSPSAKNAKLFVRNIGYSTTEPELQKLFQQVGTVLSVKIPIDRETGTQKGFGFIEMASAEEAEQAIKQLNNSYIGGKEISIDYQDPNRSNSRPRTGGGYGGGGRSSGGYGQNRSGRW